MVNRPTASELNELAEGMGFRLSEDDLAYFAQNLNVVLRSHDRIESLSEAPQPIRYARGPSRFPAPNEDPLNAWYVKARVQGAATGPLAGRKIAIKDNIAVAGLPMMNGADGLRGYVPEADATVVTRVLDAGGEIAGKAQCEYYCLSGGSHTGAQGPVQNPRKPGHSAAGSSSGCAALVAAGEVDMAIGGDQGGSIRTPASYCGIVGMKPTWGLVPYTGAMPIETTLDHLGPMTRTVADNALLLSVIAGRDGLDPRQMMAAEPTDYCGAIGQDCTGLRIGVLAEGFGHENSDPVVDATVRRAAESFRAMGAVVTEISVPMHHIGPDIWTVIAFEGATAQMMLGGSHGYGWKGFYLTSLIEAHRDWREHATGFPDTVKSTMLAGAYAAQVGGGALYAKAQNLGRQLTAAFDMALAQVDILLMPTTPMTAPPLPPLLDGSGRDQIRHNAPRALRMQRATENMANTFTFDITGHPALSLPCGVSDGLPIGMMLVGRHFDEQTLYRAADAYEKADDWTKSQRN